MKHLKLLTVFLMFSALSFGQTQSTGGVVAGLTNPIAQFGGQENFRFQPGLVTQLGQGSQDFEFDQQWFSIGQLSTANQTVYGIRFQLPNRGVTFGYQDIGDSNPRIQWIGTGQNLGNFEFRVANSFMSTNSDLVATMRNDTGTVFGDAITGFQNAKVGILSKFRVGLQIDEVGSTPDSYGILVNDTSSGEINYGVFSRAANAEGVNFGVYGIVSSDAQTNIAIYGRASIGGNNFAGFFDGDVFTTGGYFPSDQNLKESIDKFSFALDEVMKLKPMNISKLIRSIFLKENNMDS